MTRKISSILLATVAGLSAMPLAARAETGDAEAGRKVFARCAICHTIGAGEKAKVGPNLHGLIGRVSGTSDGYAYSAAMKDAKITWSAQTLDAYLTKPQAMIKGTKMAFAGVPNPTDRANLIAYLVQASQ